jgi:hypothetical protein
MWKTALLLAVAVIAASPSYAISRYDTPSMTCTAVQDAIDREAAAILRYPSKRVNKMVLYDRYVSSGRQCDFGESAQESSVPTRDKANCNVYRCEPRCRQSVFRDC